MHDEIEKLCDSFTCSTQVDLNVNENYQVLVKTFEITDFIEMKNHFNNCLNLLLRSTFYSSESEEEKVFCKKIIDLYNYSLSFSINEYNLRNDLYVKLKQLVKELLDYSN